MAIVQPGLQISAPISGLNRVAQATTLALFLSGAACTPAAPDHYEKVCEPFVTQANHIWGDRKLSGLEKRQTIYRLSRDFSARFSPSSIEAEALKDVATIASERIPCGPLGINSEQSYFILVLSSILFGIGVFQLATHGQKNEEERNNVSPFQKYGLPTILFALAFACSSAKCTQLIGDPTSTPQVRPILSTKDCQNAWKHAHKNQHLGPGS